MSTRRLVLLALLLVAGVTLLGCAPGNARWPEGSRAANFWAGLWHGLIVVVTFIISLFNDKVFIYEAHNVGHGYDIGFIIGCMISLGAGARASAHKKRRRPEVDWDSVSRRISDGIREGLRERPESRSPEEPDWDELGRRIEERVKDELNKAGFKR